MKGKFLISNDFINKTKEGLFEIITGLMWLLQNLTVITISNDFTVNNRPKQI